VDLNHDYGNIFIYSKISADGTTLTIKQNLWYSKYKIEIDNSNIKLKKRGAEESSFAIFADLSNKMDVNCVITTVKTFLSSIDKTQIKTIIYIS
jgi:hypothetical protein